MSKPYYVTRVQNIQKLKVALNESEAFAGMSKKSKKYGKLEEMIHFYNLHCK